MPFSKGQSGNPGGRPKKGESFSAILLEMGDMRDVADASNKKIARKKALANRLWQLALEGNIKAIEYIYNRVQGTPRQAMEHTGGVDLNFRIDWGDGTNNPNESGL